MNRKLVLIAHNLRSSHNVGALLRTADGLGIQKVYFTGYTPYPAMQSDTRLPHLAQKTSNQIHKTALGAETSVNWTQQTDIKTAIDELKQIGYTIAALEQSPKAQTLTSYKGPKQVALIVGREVEGLEAEVLNLADVTLEIPMLGQKESFNVALAAAMALYHLRF